MTPKSLAQCLLMLSGLPSASPWNSAASGIYTQTIESWDDEIGLAAVTKACRVCEWRPAPAKLIEIAVELAMPAPSQSETREAMRLAVLYHGRKASGASTPFLCSVVEGLGGWSAVCAMTSEEIAERFERAYKAAIASRSTDSIDYLSLPASQRNAPLIPSTQSIEQSARQIPVQIRQISSGPRGEGARGPQTAQEVLIARLSGMPAAHVGNSTGADKPAEPARRRF